MMSYKYVTLSYARCSWAGLNESDHRNGFVDEMDGYYSGNGKTVIRRMRTSQPVINGN